MNRQRRRALEARKRQEEKKAPKSDSAATPKNGKDRPVDKFYTFQEDITRQVVRESYGDDPACEEAMDKVFGHTRGQYANIIDLLRNLSDGDSHQGRCIGAMRDAVNRVKSCHEKTESPVLDGMIAKLPELKESIQQAKERELREPVTKAMSKLLAFTNQSRQNAFHRGIVDMRKYEMDTVGEAFVFMVDAANRESFIADRRWRVVSTLDEYTGFRDAGIVPEFERYMSTIESIAKRFAGQIKDDGDLAVKRLACFKSMCYKMTGMNAERFLFMRTRASWNDNYSLAIDSLRCPYILLHEDQLLERLADISSRIKSPNFITVLCQSRTLLNPGHELDSLSELVDALSDEKDPKILNLVSRLHASDALSALLTIRTRPEFLELYKEHMFTETMQINADSFLEYMAEVADMRLGSSTFHHILEQVLPNLDNYSAGTIVSCASDLYLSGLWEDIALLLSGNMDERRIGMDAVYNIKKGDVESARQLVSSGKILVNEKKAVQMQRDIEAVYPSANQDEVLKILFACMKLELSGVDPHALHTIRRNGLSAVLSAADEIEAMDRRAILAIFTSDTLSSLFGKTMADARHQELAPILNVISSNPEPGDVPELIEAMLQRYREESNELAAGRFRRIVLIAGDKISGTLEPRLWGSTNIEVKVISPEDAAKKSYISSVIKQGDAVVISISHLGHCSSGTAIALCRSRGIPYFMTSQTSAKLLAERIKAA